MGTSFYDSVQTLVCSARFELLRADSDSSSLTVTEPLHVCKVHIEHVYKHQLQLQHYH